MLPSSAKVVVCDAGPLISLGRLDLLQLLPALFAQVQVPEQVLSECLARPGQADTLRIEAAVQSAWLEVCAGPLLEGAPELGLGERAAIGQAMAIGAGLLADDRGAVAAARAHGLDVVGTLGVLVLAKRAGLLPAVAPLIDALRRSGQRLGQPAAMAALAAAGEVPP